MVRKFVKRYGFFIAALSAAFLILIFNRQTGKKTFSIAEDSFVQMLEVLPPIMVMLGLMDEWVSRETMIKYMGRDSGILGIFLSILIGSVGAGPMYAAFPFTAVLLKKGAKLSNIIIFMNAWCVTKISTLLFEITSLGYKFTFIRFLVNLPGIILMGYMVEWIMHKSDKEKVA